MITQCCYWIQSTIPLSLSLKKEPWVASLKDVLRRREASELKVNWRMKQKVVKSQEGLRGSPYIVLKQLRTLHNQVYGRKLLHANVVIAREFEVDLARSKCLAWNELFGVKHEDMIWCEVKKGSRWRWCWRRMTKILSESCRITTCMPSRLQKRLLSAKVWGSKNNESSVALAMDCHVV